MDHLESLLPQSPAHSGWPLAGSGGVVDNG